MNPDWLTRPARKQIKKTNTVSTVKEDAGGTYNIWYNRYSGERGRGSAVIKAESRCKMERDAGKTRARPGTYFCIHFARGACYHGHECQFFHRTPEADDRFDLTFDCFGREKGRDEREDQGGVGSFEKENRTLYVGRIHVTNNSEECVWRHFEEWGEIESMRLLSSKGVAFVRYKSRSNAEFAREAMFGQALDHGEVINVRWATEDPNPYVVEQNKRTAEEAVARAAAKTLPVLGEQGQTYLDYDGYYYNTTYDDENTGGKRQRIEGGGGVVAPSGGETATPQEYFKYYMDCAKYYHDNGDEANATVYRQYADYYAPGAPGALNAATAAPPPPPAHAEYRKQQDGHEGKENGHDVPVAPSQAAKKTAPPPSAPQKSLGIISGYGSDDDDE